MRTRLIIRLAVYGIKSYPGSRGESMPRSSRQPVTDKAKLKSEACTGLAGWLAGW